MTSNTIAYATLNESRRHNIMDESIRQNANQETRRHNVSSEVISSNVAGEQKRHNYADETKNWFQAYSGASAQAVQAQAALQNAIANQLSVNEQRRHNIASEQYESAFKSAQIANLAAQTQYVSGPQSRQSEATAQNQFASSAYTTAQQGLVPLQQGKLISDIELTRARSATQQAQARVAHEQAKYAAWNAATDTVSRTIKPVTDIFHGYQSVEQRINGGDAD